MSDTTILKRTCSWAALGLLVSLAGCSAVKTELDDIHFADDQLRNGGLEDPTTRAGIQARYDEALRRFEADPDRFSLAQGREIRSHAHFGLAMTRMWDLLDQMQEILQAGDYFRSVFPQDSDVQADTVNCKILGQLGDTELVLRTLLNTAIVPIVSSLTEVTKYPEFSLDIARSFYRIPDFGENAGVDLSGEYSAAEVYLMLGGLQVISSGANFLFAYQELVDVLAAFLLVNFQAIDNNPAKFFNSNPCVNYGEGNPLLSADFGILRPDGVATLELSRQQLSAGLSSLALAVDAMRTPPAPDDDGTENNLAGVEQDCAGDYAVGCRWGEGIVHNRLGDSRFVIDREGIQSGVSSLEAFVDQATPDVDLAALSDVIRQVQASVAGGKPVEALDLLGTLLPSILTESGRSIEFLDAQIPTVSYLNLPIVDFGAWFEYPPTDLKRILPLIYEVDEKYIDENPAPGRTPEIDIVEGRRVLRSSLSSDDYEDTFWDVNCDGSWNQRGDLRMQRETEPFRDINFNGLIDRAQEVDNAKARIGDAQLHLYPAQIGVVGAFVDINADGRPDRSLDDARAGLYSFECYAGYAAPVSWPGSTADPLYDQHYFSLLAGGAYGLPATSGEANDPLPSAEGYANYETGAVMGLVLGHYWPSADPNDVASVSEAQTDRSNGTYDPQYFFFADPSLGGLLLGSSAQGASRDAWTNPDLNRLLSDFRDFVE